MAIPCDVLMYILYIILRIFFLKQDLQRIYMRAKSSKSKKCEGVFPMSLKRLFDFCSKNSGTYCIALKGIDRPFGRGVESRLI